jgi:hypothetical protein
MICFVSEISKSKYTFDALVVHSDKPGYKGISKIILCKNEIKETKVLTVEIFDQI